MRRLAVGLLASLLVAGSVLAIDTEGPLPDPQMQARFERITNELRCLVCQNQTIADSNAELAQDLRAKTREMLLAGASDDEIRSYMTDRYGDFVLYRPPLTPRTWILWAAPVLLLFGGALAVFMVIRRRSHGDDLPEVGEDPFANLADEDRT
jgi:cytochrome c-type biogenesis protein CcmH